MRAGAVRTPRLAVSAMLAMSAIVACESNVQIQRPGPPSRLRASVEGCAVQLSWSAEPGAAGYAIYFASATGVRKDNYGALPDGRRQTSAGTEHSICFAKPDHNRTFFFVVTSITGKGESAESPELSATPPGDAPVAPQPIWSVFGDTGDRMGAALVFGDTSGDGLDDLIVGSPGFALSQGKISHFMGGPKGLPQQPGAVRTGPGAGGFGSALAFLPDILDATGDVLVGEPRGGPGLEGRAYLYFGDPEEGLQGGSSWMVAGAQPDQHFGSTIAIGDVTADLAFDAIIGSPDWDDVGLGLVDAGNAYVFSGTGGTLATSYVAQFRGTQDNERAGAAIATAQLSGNGKSDVLVGSPGFDGISGIDAGRVQSFLGDALGTASFTWDGPVAGTRFGSALAAAELDGAPGDEFFVSAPSAADSSLRAFHHGDAATVLQAVGFAGEIGLTLAAADLTRDGLTDVFAGSPALGAGGSVVLFVPKPPDLPLNDWVSSGQTGSLNGSAVAVGDVNGDGYFDVAIGAPDDATVGAKAGAAYLYLGRPLSGPRVEAGLMLDGSMLEPLSPVAAGFADAAPLARFRCTWDFGDGSPPEVIEPCTTIVAGAVQHTWTTTGVYAMRLRVECVDGRAGEGITMVRIR